MGFYKISKNIFFCIRHSRFSSVRYVCQFANSLNEQNETLATEHNLNESGKKVPISVDEFRDLRKLKPCQPIDPHLLKVCILGEPNVGKSTLTNNLVKWRVCAVSRKVHTTRKKASAILVEDNKQIVFLDTPGFVSHEQRKKHFLEPSFFMDPIKSIRDADTIAVVIDISNRFINCRIPEDILNILKDFKEKKSILILNKIDAMKSKNRILSSIRILTGGLVAGAEMKHIDKELCSSKVSQESIVDQNNKHQLEMKDGAAEGQEIATGRGWPSFSRVFLLSALKNDGVDDLRKYLLSEAKPHTWMYHDSAVTDQHPHDIALTTVREKLLEYLPQEIPYNLNLKVAKWEILSSGCPKIDILICCPNSRHRRFVIGPGGRHIATCADKSRRAMREAFRRDVVLHLGVL